MIQATAQRLLAFIRLVNGRWAAILVPIAAMAFFAYHRALGPTLWALVLFVAVPFLMLRLFLEQVAGRADDPRDPGQPIGRLARGFLAFVGVMSFFTLLSYLDEGLGFGGVSALLMGPTLLAVGLRGRAYGALGRAAIGRRQASSPAS